MRAAADRLVAFLNTLYVPDGDDELADERATRWLSRWLDEPAQAATADRGRTLEPETLGELRDLREGLRNLLAPVDSLEAGSAAEDAAAAEDARAAAIARASAVLRGRQMVVELGGTAREPSLTSADGLTGQAIAAVATAYLVVRSGGDWARLKVCADPTCRWAFLDTSRNRSRRWCDMADCGNRAKNRVWRERQRHRAAES